MFGSMITRYAIYDYELLVFTDLLSLYNFLFILKNHTFTQYKMLTDLIGHDFLGRRFRFRLIYLLLSCFYSSRLHVILDLNTVQMLPSVIKLFLSAKWQEREVWDLFGLLFAGNFYLRRILTDYGFTGFPLRKDFPLVGFVELFYDDQRQRLIYVLVSLAQELRIFRYTNPWETNLLK